MVAKKRETNDVSKCEVRGRHEAVLEPQNSSDHGGIPDGDSENRSLPPQMQCQQLDEVMD